MPFFLKLLNALRLSGSGSFIAFCTTSSFLCLSTMCLCKFVCIVEQNGQGLGILLFFFFNLPVPGATVCSNRGTTSGICSCFTLAGSVIPLTTSPCGSEPLIGNCIGDGVILLGKKGISHDSSGTAGDSSILSIRGISLRSDSSSLLLSDAFDAGT